MELPNGKGLHMVKKIGHPNCSTILGRKSVLSLKLKLKFRQKKISKNFVEQLKLKNLVKMDIKVCYGVDFKFLQCDI